MRLELKGLPVAVIATDAFKRSVAEQLEAVSFTQFEPVYVPHPIASLPVDRVQGKADGAIPEIAARLTGQKTSDRERALPAEDGLEPDGGPDCEACAVEFSDMMMAPRERGR
jgi:hypothetical protein